MIRGAPEPPLSACGPGTPAATAASACSASRVVPCSASARAASAAFVPVVITSPATRAPHICQAISVLGRLKRLTACVRFPAGLTRAGLDSEQGADRQVGQLGAAVQEGQLEEHAETGHLGAGTVYQVSGRPGGAAGGQHVVDDQDAV